MSKVLKDSKKAIWPHFPVVYRAFALHDLGHSFKEVDNVLCLQLPKFLGRQYDPFGVVGNFTTMVKIKVFSHEEYPFHDAFLQKNTFREVLHTSKIVFDQEGLQNFDKYRKQRLSKVPLDQLLIEPIREPTPSVSISEDSKEKSKTSSEKESAEKSRDQSKSAHSKSEESIKDTTQSTAKADQQALSPKQAEVPTPLTKQINPLVIDLEGEWEDINKILNTEEQSTEPSTNPKETTTEMEIERAINTQGMEHIHVSPSYEIVLRIEEIPPLYVFYSP